MVVVLTDTCVNWTLLPAYELAPDRPLVCDIITDLTPINTFTKTSITRNVYHLTPSLLDAYASGLNSYS